MPKKNMGKVKHYKHSFYSGSQAAKRVLALVLGGAALLALGWFIGPLVLDFGTHTWYSMKESLNSAPSQPAQSAPEAPAQSQAAPAPTPEPTPAPIAVVEGDWSYVTISSIATAEQAASTAQQLAGQGVKYAVVTLKDAQGYLYYPSGVELAGKSVAASTIDAAAAAKAFRDAGLIPVAALSVFRDPVLPYTDRSLGIRYQTSDYYWLDARQDAGGKPWVNPYSDVAAGFIADLIREVQGLGYDQVLLTGAQFPNAATTNMGFGETGDVAPADRLAKLLADWTAQITAGDQGVLWVEYPLAALSADSSYALGGGSIAGLGVKNLVITLPTDPAEDQEAQLAAASGAAREAGAEHIVLHNGSTGQFANLAG